jgi:nicotinamide mononucleotide transporter
LVQTFYGFWKWKQKTDTATVLIIRSITFAETIATGVIMIVLTALIAAIQGYFNTNLSVETQLTDSFLTACSIVGTWMLAQKIIQNWLLWIVIDIIYVGLLYQQALWTAALNYALFVALAIYGWYSWQTEKKQK